MLDIRPATASDAGTLFRFIRALAEYEHMLDDVEVDEATLAAQLGSASPPFECFIAEDAGTPVGYALVYRTYSTFRGRSGVWLEDLFVLPEHRRRGVGRTLLERVVSMARDRDAGRVEWAVLDWNAPAIEFYRTFGARLLENWRICRVSL